MLAPNDTDFTAILPPNREMMRLRDMLDAEGIRWSDNSDALFCRTQLRDEEDLVFSAVCGPYAYGEIELWTRTMRDAKVAPWGLGIAEEAMALIRREVGA